MNKKRKIPKSDLPQGPSSCRRRVPVTREAIVTRIAKEVRTQYIRRRRAHETTASNIASMYEPSVHWDGGVSRCGHRRSSIWESVAKFCIKHKLDHFDYVQQIFINPPSRRSPQPNHLLSQRVLRQYREASCAKSIAAKVAYINTAFEAERCRLHERLSEWADIINHDESRDYTEYEIQRAILGDDNLALTPLFRFCLAIQQQQDDIAEYYYAGAILQYLRFAPAYRIVWGPLIPSWFRKKARRCQRALTAG